MIVNRLTYRHRPLVVPSDAVQLKEWFMNSQIHNKGYGSISLGKSGHL